MFLSRREGKIGRKYIIIIIITDESLLTIFRRKVKGGVLKEYYVIPGGGLEKVFRRNVIRELKEKFGIDINAKDKVSMALNQEYIERN